MDGVWIAIIGNRTAVVTVEPAMDGGMVEFFDAVSGDPRGCAGINWWNTNEHRVAYDGPLPSIPEPARWS